MPLIPDIQPLDGAYRPSVASPQAAGAPGQAAANLGRDVQQSAGVLVEIHGKYQAARDNGAKNAARLMIQQAQAEHAQFRLQNPDESTWGADIEGRLGKARESIFQQDMSPFMRTEMEATFAGWQQEASSATMLDATKQGVTRARQRSTNAVRAYKEAGDFESARRVVAESRDANVWLPEEAEADLLDIGSEEKDWQIQQQDKATRGAIAEDPAAWLESNPQDAAPADVDPVTYQQQRGYARELLRERTYDVSAAIQDGMVSQNGQPPKITRPEQIEELAGDLRPAVREELKAELARRADAATAAERSTPEYQAKVVGKVTAMLSRYKADGDDFDRSYVEMEMLARSMPEGAMKSELMRQLKDTREGQLGQIRTNQELAEKALVDAYNANRFGDVSGTGKASISLRAALDDGLLTDAAKLERLGFSADKAKEIATADEDKRTGLFRTEFQHRTGIDRTTPLERAAFLAVRDGKPPSSMIEVDDPEAMDAAITARDAADERLGKARIELLNFARANPQAGRKEFEDEVYRIAGDEVRQQMKGKLLTPRPGSTGPQGASNETSAVPQGKSLTEVVKHFEAGGAPQGFHPEAYWDNGQYSIGYGTKARKGETITQAEAEQRLQSELSMHRDRVTREAGRLGIPLAPHELDALTSFDFNTGRIEQLLAGGKRSKAEIAEKMLLYRNSAGQRLRGLERRRRAEQQIFLNGY